MLEFKGAHINTKKFQMAVGKGGIIVLSYLFSTVLILMGLPKIKSLILKLGILHKGDSDRHDPPKQ